MKIGNEIRECKIHGKTNHGIYVYGKSRSSRCLECVKEKKAQRSSDPEKRAHDQKYTKVWISENKDHVKNLHQKLLLKKKREKLDRVVIFLAKNTDEISLFLEKLESPLTFEDIKNHCFHFGTSSMEEVKEFIEGNKLSHLRDAEAWKQSTIVKYHHGVLENYSEIPEAYKEKIRAEYKTKAFQIAKEKIRKLLK